MNRGPLIFLGVLATMAFSWYGMIVAPLRQIGGQQQVTIAPTNARYPVSRPGLAYRGADVYRANGCAYCHTQQVRPRGYGADIERGWGMRMSAAQDFLYDELALVGQMRMGPDLANVGVRLADQTWHYRHLYNPKSTVEGSTMPQYPYLFEKRIIGGNPSPDALELSGEFAPPNGYEIVPTPDARALVAYLLSLKSQASLFEAPLPLEPASEESGGDTGESAASLPEGVSNGLAQSLNR